MRIGGPERDPGGMATLDEKARDRLSNASFGYVDGRGGRHLPIHDAVHVRNAMSRFDETDFDDAAAKRRAARKILRAAKRLGIDVATDDAVARSARG